MVKISLLKDGVWGVCEEWKISIVAIYCRTEKYNILCSFFFIIILHKIYEYNIYSTAHCQTLLL